MIFVKRNAPEPKSLSAAQTVKERKDAVDYYKTWKPGDAGFGAFNCYRNYDIKLALAILFHNKCAYCEKYIEKGMFEVEHYRPKSAALGDPHPGYWWLASRWENLLPTCPGCNKALKQHVVTADMTIAEVEEIHRHSTGKLCSFPLMRPVS
jgi:hypothetical protein